MLNDVYIVGNGAIDFHSAAGIDECIVLHLVDLDNKHDLLALIEQYYHSITSQKYAIALKSISSAKADDLLDLMLLLAHPCHLGAVGEMKVFLVDAVPENAGVIESFLIDQGYKQPKVISITSSLLVNNHYYGLYNSNGDEVHCTSRNDFRKLYKTYMECRYEPNAFMVIKELTSFTNSYLWLQVVKDLLRKDNTYLFNLLQQLYTTHKQTNYAVRLAEKYRADLETYNKLFEENAKNNEIDFILNFYHSEYEVLPLWFKRLGHIIKAVIGKRSWTSLVRNNDK